MEDHPKIYFKGNAVTNNNYIPKSALNNRKPRHFMVEMPEGQNYFISSKKKQFSHLHHQSEIKDLSIFASEEKVKKPNNLDTHDIEGAYANTLQSQALKNRNKVSYFASKKSSQQTPELSWQSLNHQTNTKTNPKLNYHLKQKLKTQPPSSDFEKYQLRDRRKNYENFSKRISEVETPINAEKQRRQTESKLEQMKQMERQKLRKVQLQLQKYKEKERERDEELSRQISRQEEKKRLEEAKIKEEKSFLQQKRQENRERINFIKKQQKSREDLTRMWHGDTKKLNLIPYQQIRKWNPTYFPEHFPSSPYHSNQTSALHLPKIQ